MTTTLAEIRAAVDNLQATHKEYELARLRVAANNGMAMLQDSVAETKLRDAQIYIGGHIDWLTDLIAIAEAADNVSNHIDPDELESMDAKRYFARMEDALSRVKGVSNGVATTTD